MKKSLFVASIFMTLVFQYGYANTNIGGTKDTITITFKVNGNASCKANIEATVNTQTGVLSASWDATALMITVKYIASKIQASDLQTLIALAGYDTSDLKAKQVAYDALSPACKYTRNP